MDDLAALSDSDQRLAQGRNDATEIVGFYTSLIEGGLPEEICNSLVYLRSRTKWAAVWGIEEMEDEDDED